MRHRKMTRGSRKDRDRGQRREEGQGLGPYSLPWTVHGLCWHQHSLFPLVFPGKGAQRRLVVPWLGAGVQRALQDLESSWEGKTHSKKQAETQAPQSWCWNRQKWHLPLTVYWASCIHIDCVFLFAVFFFFFFNKKFYWRKIEPPRTQGKEHKNSTDTELKVTTTQCCLWLLFDFLNGFHQFFK